MSNMTKEEIADIKYRVDLEGAKNFHEAGYPWYVFEWIGAYYLYRTIELTHGGHLERTPVMIEITKKQFDKAKEYKEAESHKNKPS